MPCAGIELATFRSLARRSNQLSYAAAMWKLELVVMQNLKKHLLVFNFYQQI